MAFKGFLFCAVFCLLAVSGECRGSFSTPPNPLHFAHSHNDYEQERPLLDALERGFTSVEADIFLRGQKLLVGHSEADLKEENTLEKLYFSPLQEWVQQNSGRIFADDSLFILMLDFKSEATSTYLALKPLLEKYSKLLSSEQNGVFHQGPITIVLSGHRPWDLVVSESNRFVGLDGRLRDLHSDLSPHLVPVISDSWFKHFTWTGVGPLPWTERKKLQFFAEKARQKGRKLRFWGTPNLPWFWKELRLSGVDLINADAIGKASKLLKSME